MKKSGGHLKWYQHLLAVLFAAAAVTGVVLLINFEQITGKKLNFPGIEGTVSDTAASQPQSAADGQSAGLGIHYIDVGQGSAALIICDGEAMVVDAGSDDKGTLMKFYLQKQGVSHLKYAVATHYDEDHIGGMDAVLYRFGADIVFEPDYEKNTANNRRLQDTIRQQSLTRKNPQRGETYQLGSGSFTILSDGLVHEEDNDNSIVFIFTYGQRRFYFGGDLTEDGEALLVESGQDLRADVYLADHHGSNLSSRAELLGAMQPSYAVISCGIDNTNNHPGQYMLERLAQRNISVYRTDTMGTVIARCDGNNIWFELPGKQDQEN